MSSLLIVNKTNKKRTYRSHEQNKSTQLLKHSFMSSNVKTKIKIYQIQKLTVLRFYNFKNLKIQKFQENLKKKEMIKNQEYQVQQETQTNPLEENQVVDQQDRAENQNALKQVTKAMMVKENILVPYKVLTGHWMTISRPQYQRTCGISSLVSLWNFQFSRLGMGNKQPITIEQAMLKLNLIGNGSIEQGLRKKFKKTAQLTQKPDPANDPSKQPTNDPTKQPQKPEQSTSEKSQDTQIRKNNLSLFQYVNTIDFGCFTGNDTLLRWYRLLCRIFGGSGRSYLFYKTNSDRSLYKTEQEAKRALVQGLNSNGKTCFIYHAYDHYFCPVGYEFVPKGQENPDGTFKIDELNEEGNELYVMIGESSKMFPCMHVVKWSDIQLDLSTYWPQFFNIRRRKQGVQFQKGKENEPSRGNTIDCIMAFEKMKD